MRVEALVMAGGSTKGSMLQDSEESNKALIKIGGRIMVDYVVRVLKACPEIERIVVVGPVEVLKDYFQESRQLLLAPEGDTPMASVRQGIKTLKPEKMLLVATGDVPLLGSDAVNDFLSRSVAAGEADLYYPIVRKEVNEAKYPGVRRTYIRFRDGIFTGGNLFLLRPEIVESCFAKGEELVSLRKKPFALSRQIGPLFILKFLLHVLTLAEAERQFSHLLGLRGRAIESPYPEIGIDVDKPSDLELVRKVLVS